MGDLFKKIPTIKLPYKADNLPKQPIGKYELPCLTSSFQNQGLNYYAPTDNATVLQNVISIPSNSDVYRAYYQSRPFTILSDAYAICWKREEEELSPNQYLFIVMCINKVTDLAIYSYKNKLGGWNVVQDKNILLPIKQGKIDLDFMENFIAELEAQYIAELEAYLSITGLKDTHLTLEEEQVLRDFDKIHWGEFNVEDLFGNSTRGKRLKSTDRIPGTLPFVTAGEASEGVSAFIGNDVRQFSSNTTTVDMFGSAKYRNYPYGGDDHIAVVHTENLPEYAAIFVTTAIHKSAHNGQFDYGRNCYAKDVDALTIFLPITEANTPNYDLMKTIISGIHKLVIQDVVTYSTKKAEATKKVINN
ncbi:restriction endonuclease subunit S [Allobaculum mucilyticum]|nr:restriction endonuclease subunit S [Allobaculum mucilyticum]